MLGVERPPRAAPRCLLLAWASVLGSCGAGAGQRPCGRHCADDAGALFQVAVAAYEASADAAASTGAGADGAAAAPAVRRANLRLAREPYEASTIGGVAPRILTDDAIDALRQASSEREDEAPAAEYSMNEAIADKLAAEIGVALNRFTARCDLHLTRVMHAKEKLISHVAQSPEGADRLLAFEAAVNESLDVAQQGSATVAVVLRSTVSSTEANLESAGQRELAAHMEEALGGALSRFDFLSPPAFVQAREHAMGLNQEAGAAAQHLAGLREALREHRRHANALGHALYRQYQDVASAISGVADASGLPPVATARVRTAFHAVEESAAANAWKLYLPAWELATGVGVASSELGVHADEAAAESADEPLGGEIVSLEVTPSKPPAARPVTRELDGVEQQVDALLGQTMEARRQLQEAIGASDQGRPESFESRVASTLAAVEPGWRALGEALARTAKSITRCLETAGEREASLRLESMFGDTLMRSHHLSHILDEPAKLSASLEVFLQRQDVLAQSFFRTYHEFMTGIGHSPSGRAAGPAAISLRSWREQSQRRATHAENRTAHEVSQAIDGLCAALGSQRSDRPMDQQWLLQERHSVRFGQGEEDEDDEVARRMFRRVQEVAFGSAQQAAAIAWKIHSAAWVLVSGIRKATLGLIN
mmetsp:Transcript_97252/g.270619  ORF Transcript_97252/g.270619 Transcript_97252/m.270619 type:complete len:656 (-) Transcript_97252:130-2097(-)